MSLRQFNDFCDPYNWSGTAGLVLTGMSRLVGINVIDGAGSAGAAVVHLTEASAGGASLHKFTAVTGVAISMAVPIRCNGIYASAVSSTAMQITILAVDDRKG